MTCRYCGNELHQYEQPTGPYTRGADGYPVPTGRTVIVECIQHGCPLWMVTAAVPNYTQTTDPFMPKAEAVHA